MSEQGRRSGIRKSGSALRNQMVVSVKYAGEQEEAVDHSEIR